MIRKTWNRLRRWLWLGPWILVAVVLAVGIYGYGLQAARLDAALGALGDEQSAAEDRGDEPVAPAPSELMDDPTYEGPSPGANGQDGADGSDGRGIADVACLEGEWHVRYTDGTVDNDAGDCTGEDGPTGKPGKDGKDGVGSPGPPGSDGADGQDGTDGADGRGVTNIECDEDTGRWRVEYSDGTTDEDAGPCRPGLGN